MSSNQNQDYNDSHPQRHEYLQLVYILHFFIAAVLLYVGVQYFREEEINPFWFSALILLGFGALGYHGYWFINSFYSKHSD